MPVARFKDLCVDAVDLARMTDFWAAALGLTPQPHKSHVRALTGPTPQHTVWVNQVAEPVTVKQHVDVDVNGRSVAEYEAAGARVLPEWGPFDWTVMADPEGGELCVFVRDGPPAARHEELAPDWESAYRGYELCIDSRDGAASARWWAEVFGAPVRDSDRGFSWVEGIPGCPLESLVFVDVPEPKTVKNRIHWDVTVADDAAITELVERSARVLRTPDDQIDWTVLADPEGNEFCAFVDAAT